jgi:uncharacterized protein YkwD
MIEQVAPTVNVPTIAAPVVRSMQAPLAVMQHRLDAHVWAAVAKDASNPAAQQVAIAMLAAAQGAPVPPQALAGAGAVAAGAVTAGAPGSLPMVAAPGLVAPAAPGVPNAMPPVAAQTVAATPAGASPQANEVVRLVNEARAAQGLAPLTLDPKLVHAAAAHSQQMASAGTMAHDGIGDGNPHDRIHKVAPGAQLTAENVAHGQPNAAAVVKGWMDSPPHRRNILDPKLTRIGVEVVPARDGTPYWTQVFAG